jgi:hypothetical protein
MRRKTVTQPSNEENLSKLVAMGIYPVPADDPIYQQKYWTLKPG